MVFVEERQQPIADSPLTLAFARQTLPSARLLVAQSINVIAREAGQAIIETCDTAPAWDLHILRAAGEEAPGPNRLRLVRAGIEANLKKRRRRLLLSLLPEMNSRPTPGTTFIAAPVLVQLYLETLDRTWLSIYQPESGAFFRRCLSPWPGGIWQAEENRLPPSRAYRKLEEALTQFPYLDHRARSLTIHSGESCVDLGASPGGWSWVALERGARVTAVDRSPLRDDIMQHARLNFVQGDAFQFRPERAVDWLLCDVIAFPGRTVELLSNWLTNHWCQKFCVTVKFRGVEDYAVLSQLKTMLNERSRDFSIRRLSENKNEVTVFGYL